MTSMIKTVPDWLSSDSPVLFVQGDIFVVFEGWIFDADNPWSTLSRQVSDVYLTSLHLELCYARL